MVPGPGNTATHETGTATSVAFVSGPMSQAKGHGGHAPSAVKIGWQGQCQGATTTKRSSAQHVGSPTPTRPKFHRAGVASGRSQLHEPRPGQVPKLCHRPSGRNTTWRRHRFHSPRVIRLAEPDVSSLGNTAARGSSSLGNLACTESSLRCPSAAELSLRCPSAAELSLSRPSATESALEEHDSAGSGSPLSVVSTDDSLLMLGARGNSILATNISPNIRICI